jgi:hypothetical protein
MFEVFFTLNVIGMNKMKSKEQLLRKLAAATVLFISLWMVYK